MMPGIFSVPVSEGETMSAITHDKKEQLQKGKAWLVPNEQLYAVYDIKGRGTGFVGSTDVRLIFMEKTFMRMKMAKLPYTKINTVDSEANGSLLFGSRKLQVVVTAHE